MFGLLAALLGRFGTGCFRLSSLALIVLGFSPRKEQDFPLEIDNLRSSDDGTPNRIVVK